MRSNRYTCRILTIIVALILSLALLPAAALATDTDLPSETYQEVPVLDTPATLLEDDSDLPDGIIINVEPPRLDNSSSSAQTEITYLLYYCDQVRSILLNGSTGSFNIYLNVPFTIENEQFKHFGYYCPYFDGVNVLTHMYYYNSGRYAYLRVTNNLTAEQTTAWINRVDAAIAELSAMVADPNMSVADQTLLLHDYMASHYHYTTNLTYSDYFPGIMVTEGRGVCQSYAYLFQYIMNRKNLECYTAVSDSMNHAWNIIGINGNYYHMDITWDDPMKDRYGQALHKYLLLSDATISDNLHSHEGWDLTNYACTDDSYESAYWAGIYTPVAFLGNDRYYCTEVNGTPALNRYNTVTGQNTVLYTESDSYPWTYLTIYSGLFEYGGKIFYNTHDTIWCYDPVAGTRTAVMTEDGAPHIYGITHEGCRFTYEYTNLIGSYGNKNLVTVDIHQYEGSTIIPATCAAEGLETGTCTICGNEVSTVIPALDHTPVLGEAVEATCTQPGHAGDTVCQTCGQLLEAGQVIPALGHAPVTGNAVEATCTQPGCTGDTVCRTCGELLTAGEVIPALGHTPVTGNAVEATCTQPGCTGDTVCQTCGELLTAGQVIPALGHTPVTGNAVEATCTQPGHTGSTICQTCGQLLTAGQVIPALGHTPVTGNAVEATCSQPGCTGDTVCQTCGELLEAGQIIPALGHNPVLVNAVEATCTQPGHTGNTICQTCGELLTAGQVIPAPGHNPVLINAVEATCTQPGHTGNTICQTCGELLTASQAIPALGHTPALVNAAEATCTQPGHTGNTICRTCGELLATGQAIPALGHTPALVNVVEATCTQTGYTGITFCQTCGELLATGHSVSALGHDFVDGFCTRCQEPDPTADFVAPEAAISLARSSLNRVALTASVSNFADIDPHDITGYGIVFITEARLDNRELTLMTSGRTKVVCSNMDRNGNFTYTLRTTSRTLRYYVRSWVSYVDESGATVTAYSRAVRFSYNSLY